MIRFAVVGTNWISHSFCEAAHQTDTLQLSAVYSRSRATAEEFANRYGVTDCYDDLQAMASNPTIDAVYIASPNSLHAPQAKLFLEHGKHVICEKPIASNVTELDELMTLAQKQERVVFEALKTRYLPNLNVCKEALPDLGKIRRAYFSYCQYSSRYQKYLDGQNPNTFNPEFSSGSLMDIGIYPLSAAVELFGKPDKVIASTTLLDSGVDAHGTLILKYPEFEAVIAHSKVSDGHIPSEIQGENGSLEIDFISEFHGVTLKAKGAEPKVLTVSQVENTMQYEAEVFAELINQNCWQHEELEKSRIVSEIMTDARRQTAVVFPAD